jgi:putative DNA methylase
MTTIRCPKKLIEVALPLDAINVAAAREKSIRHGHPSTLHLWWARRPLAAARAVLFAQLVNDPGYEQGAGFRRGVNKERAAIERERLFGIIERLVLWENTNNEEVLTEAREEIWKSWRETCQLNRDHPQAAELFNPDRLPAFHDPFAGGGSIPLEAQRLGLEAFASDLNPVAVLINKAIIEIPPKFAGMPPVGPLSKRNKQARMHEDWSSAKGLAEDVRRYGAWIHEEAEKRIGHLYPKIEVTVEMAKERPDLLACVGKKLTVVAWLWARTVKSPNPAFSHVDVPLASTFMLSSKEGKETYVEPMIEEGGYRFTVKVGQPKDAQAANSGTKLTRANFACLMSGSPVSGDYIKAEGKAGRIGARLMAIVAEGAHGRIYLAPTPEHELSALEAKPTWRPEGEIAVRMTGGNCTPYGLTSWGSLFTPRQLVTLTTFSDLVQDAINKVRQDALAAGVPDELRGLDDGGTGAKAYAEAVGVYLAMAVSKMSDAQSSLCRWKTTMDQSIATFGRQALPMVWDYSEANAFGGMAGDFTVSLRNMMRVLDCLAASTKGTVNHHDARTQNVSQGKVVSTDPPYYDNIGYADLSDFFYVWLRRSLKAVYPALFATLAAPKTEELVATRYRHGSKEEADAFFLVGMSRAIWNLADQAHPAFPVTIYYAFKQSETGEANGTSSSGWETFLEAVISAGFGICGTWPMRTELSNRIVGSSANMLASSIILVCRKRSEDAATISRREFIRELNEALPIALDEMTRGGINSPVAPVDLSQAIIGPGMAIYSKYSAVLEADGSRMSVRAALQQINRFLAEDDFDHDTQFCLHWFENCGWSEGKFGDADVLARAKGTSVEGVKTAGVLESGQGLVRLLRWAEYPKDWDPATDQRTPVWEALHHLIRALNQQSSSEAGALLARMPAKAEPVRQLAYRLYTLCERKGWAEDARAYNELITSWSSIETASHEAGHVGGQAELDM